MADFTGFVTIQGSSDGSEGRTVRAIDRRTGDLLDEDMTSSSGSYNLDSGEVDASDVIIIALPTEAPGDEPSYNAQILDQFN